MTLGLWRVRTEERVQLARGDSAAGPAQLLDEKLIIVDFLADDGRLLRTLAELDTTAAMPAIFEILAPIDVQPVWAAGVTFARSRQARKEESIDGGDIYDRVYSAQRPELFYKAEPGAAVGPGDALGARADSSWNVPEPELAVVADSLGRVQALTLGNDMSSRNIEGENPLYLPQAKVYDRSCALGPCLVPVSAAPAWNEQRIALTIRRKTEILYQDTVDLATMRRTPAELLDWLLRANTFPNGVVLLTGTSMVPPDGVTVEAGDQVTISADALGELTNSIIRVGHASTASARR